MIRYSLISTPAALAVPSSAMFAESAGRHAAALNGMKIVLQLVLNKLWHVTSFSLLYRPQNMQLKYDKPLNISAIAIIARMKDGDTFKGPIDAKNVTTICRSTFSSAGNASLGLATDAEEIGSEPVGFTK